MATLPTQLNSMTHKRIHRILLKFRALSWVAREVGVSPGTLSRFLRGERPALRQGWLKDHTEALARKLLTTNGAAMSRGGGKTK